MNRLKVFLRSYPVAVALYLAVWYLSFFTPPRTELDSVRFIDKWVHIAMYGGTCGVMWAEYLKKHWGARLPKGVLLPGWAAPIAMSGAIELLQEYCTGGRRSGDWLDLAANAMGVTLAAAAAWAVAARSAKRNKGA